MGKFNCQEMARRRKELGLSQAEIAERMGVHFTAVFHWESGRSAPHEDRMTELAKILKCKVGDIFSFASFPSRKKSLKTRSTGGIFRRTEMRKRRIELGLSLKNMADQMNVAYSTVYFWESGKCEPRPLHISQLAKILRCQIDDIFSPKSIAAEQKNFNTQEIIRRRVARGLSRKNLAAQIGTSISTLYLWETGQIVPSSQFATKLSKVLKCHIADILEPVEKTDPLLILKNHWQFYSEKKRNAIIKLVTTAR